MIRNPRTITGSSFVAMFFLGVGYSLIGAASRQIGLSAAEIGLILAVQNVGFGAAVAVSGALADALPKPRLLALGSVVLAVAFLAFYRVPGFWFNAAMMALIGIGTGVYEGVADAMLFDLQEKRAAFYVNINHLFVTVGSGLIALYMIFLQLRWRSALVQAAAIVAVLAVVFALTHLPVLRRGASSFTEKIKTIGRSPLIAILFVAAVLAVGTESSAIGLLSTYLAEVRGLATIPAQLGLVVLLAGMATGRVLVGALAQPHRLRRMILVLFAASTVTFALLFLVDLGSLTMPAAFVAGMTMSAQLPLMLSYAGLAYREMTGTVLGAVKIGIPVGGILIPLLVSGVTSAASLPVALIVLPACLLGSLVLLALPAAEAKHVSQVTA